MKSHALFVTVGLMAVLIFAGNNWIVRGCGSPGQCQCVVTLSSSGPAASGSANPSCSVGVKPAPTWTATKLSTCAIVEPGTFNKIVMCDVGIKAKLQCQNATYWVGAGTASIFSCSENGDNQAQVTASHYDGWVNNLGGTNTNAGKPKSIEARVSRLPAPTPRGPVAMATETEVLVLSGADGGIQVDNDGTPRVTLTRGSATVTSFCDGSTAIMTAPAVINIANDSALLNFVNGLGSGTYDPTAGTCALTDLSGTWRGAYFNNNSTGIESIPLLMTLQGSTGTIVTPDDTLDITSFTFSAPQLTVGATSRASGGNFSLTATVSKGQMTLDATADGIGPNGSDYSFGNGIAERLIIDQFALPNAALNAPYNVQLYDSSPSGSPVTWSIASGNLPAGMKLDGTLGTISGTAAATGNYNFTVQVTDANGDTFQQPLTLTVNNLTLAANILPPAYNGQVFQYMLQAIGGTPPYTFSNDSPLAFAGLPQLSSTGQVTLDLSGASGPSSAGSLKFHVTDSQGLSQQMVIGVPVRGLTLTGSEVLPDGVVGQPYSYAFPTSPSVGAVNWTPFTDLEPDGLHFDTTTGALSGTPAFAGSFNFTVSASDNLATDTRSFYLTIVAGIATPRSR